MTEPSKKTPKSFIFGAGGHAAEIMGSIAMAAKFVGGRVGSVGIIVDAEYVPQAAALYGHLPIFSPENVPESATWVMLAIGSSAAREDVTARYPDMPWGSHTDAGSRMEPLWTPPRERPGYCGFYLASLAYIGPFVFLGNHVHVNRAAQVAHDCVLGDFVTVGPMANLLGGVRVGKGSEIGASAVVLPGVKIGEWCRIGAGAIVTKDVLDGATVRCEPAR